MICQSQRRLFPKEPGSIMSLLSTIISMRCYRFKRSSKQQFPASILHTTRVADGHWSTDLCRGSDCSSAMDPQHCLEEVQVSINKFVINPLSQHFHIIL